jgi:hypothetical protein
MTMQGRTRMIAGKTQFAYWNDIRRKSASKKKALKAEDDTSAKLGEWFEYWKKMCSPFCENCRASINKYDPLEVRAVQAHILPKRARFGFPSVAHVRDNHLTLGVRCGCHDRFDRSWSDAVLMPVWPKALERFKLFEHLIAADERPRIPDVFLTSTT